MNIGLVSTWLHRGAAYVTINYAKLLRPEHNIFIYGRGGEYFDRGMKEDGVEIYEGLRINSMDGVSYKDFVRWINRNQIDMVLWNEQRDLSVICKMRKAFPQIKHGMYIDYYRENMIDDFAVFDFLICNTKRHYSVFNWHKQCFYLPWGCDTTLYKPVEEKAWSNEVTFFHSMGMSNRKGTDVLIHSFVSSNIKSLGAKLIIHTQVDISDMISEAEARENNIEIITKTVAAPGLYYLGDVYVYPAKLDGLGLTLYEAISCGMPVITTDVAPMNEVITKENGYLLNVEKLYSRSDGYYWPLADVSEKSLSDALRYYVEHATELPSISKEIRQKAVAQWNLQDRKLEMLKIVETVQALDTKQACDQYMRKHERDEKIAIRSVLTKLFVPQTVFSIIKTRQIAKKFKL